LIPVFLGIGRAVGFITGLLGISGGMTMMPLITLIFSDEHSAYRDGRHGGISDRGVSSPWPSAVHGGLHLPARAHRADQRAARPSLARRTFAQSVCGLMYVIAAFFYGRSAKAEG
jgi:hypothetical protein